MLATICSCHCSIKYSFVLEIVLRFSFRYQNILRMLPLLEGLVSPWHRSNSTLKTPAVYLDCGGENRCYCGPTLNIVSGKSESITYLFHNVGKLTRTGLMACTGLKEGSAWEKAALEIKTKLILLASKLRGKSALGAVVKWLHCSFIKKHQGKNLNFKPSGGLFC